MEYGYQAQLVFDQDDGLHAIWLQGSAGSTQHDFFYANYPAGSFIPNQEKQVHSTILSISSGLFGPQLGLDQSGAYLVWTEVIRTGLQAGDISAYAINIPFDRGKGDLGTFARIDLLFPNGYKLNYQDAQQEGQILNSGERAYAEGQNVPVNATQLVDLAPASKQQGEMVVAFRARLPYLSNREANQVGLLFMGPGDEFSYQLLSFSPAISELPALFVDEQNYLHVTWLEEPLEGDYRLYYATTEPTTRSILDTFSSQDYLVLGEQVVFGMFSGMLLIPFPLFWLMAPLAVVFITGFLRRGEKNLRDPGTLLSLALGLGAYIRLKLISLPGLTNYVPFSAWVPHISEDWAGALRVGVPLGIGVLGLIAAYLRTYRRQNNSPLFFFLIYTLVDGVLTMAIYGVIFYGAI